MHPTRRLVTPLAASPFDESPDARDLNASEVIPLGDGRFLFCDNNIGDTLFEMRFDRRGRLRGPLIRHTITGVSRLLCDDFESMTLAGANDRRYLIISASLSLKARKRHAKAKSRRGRPALERESLLRVTLSGRRRHTTEIIPGFRTWLADNAPDLGRAWRKSVRRIPDDGGLNVEGLAWVPESSELLFGLRTPVLDGHPVVLRVHVRDIGGTWNLDNLTVHPPVLLAPSAGKNERGIRTMEYDPVHRRVLIVTGNARSGRRVPFELWAWDGNAEGRITKFDRLQFDPRFRVEGVTPGTIGGRGAIVFVDDRGGYQVLWDDDERLSPAAV